jgi:gliding motility-associated-like protein
MGQSEYGCITSKSIRVRVKKNYDLKIYNIVTPDNNGLNDTWQIENISSYPDNKVLLFDQWNNLVFEETNYSNDWAGRNKRGELLPPGTYFDQLYFFYKNISRIYYAVAD